MSHNRPANAPEYNFENMPLEVQVKIIQHLDSRDALSVKTVSMKYNEVTQTAVQMKAGADDYVDFKQRMIALKTHSMLHEYVWDDFYKLSDAEKVKSILILPKGERLGAVLSAKQYHAMQHKDYLNDLFSDNGIMALHEKLITITLADEMPSKEHLVYLLSDHGLKVLRSHIITAEQATKIRDSLVLNDLITIETILIEYLKNFGLHTDNEQLIMHGMFILYEKLIVCAQLVDSRLKFRTLLTIEGLEALFHNLITPQQAAAMPLGHLKYMFSHGMSQLRDRLITPEEAVTLPTPMHAMYLFIQGLDALKNGLITVAQAAKISLEELEFLLSNTVFLKQRLKSDENKPSDLIWDHLAKNVAIVYKENLITAEQAQQLFDTYLACLLTDNGIFALRKKLISPEQINYTKTLAMRGKVVYLDSCIAWLLSNNGISALEKKLISFDNLDELLVFNERCFLNALLPVLHDNLFTFAEFSQCNYHVQEALLHNKIIIALREKLISMEVILSASSLHGWAGVGKIENEIDNKINNKLNQLIEQSERNAPGTTASFLFIRESLMNYCQSSKVVAAFTAAIGLFTDHLKKHHTAAVAELLAKDEYKTFDAETLAQFFAELRAKLDVDKINQNGDLHAIFVVARHFAGVDFYSVEVRKEYKPER